MSLTDHQLMLQVVAGHTDRLATLYDRHQRRLFNFFRKLGHGRAASEDLVQDSFLRMLRYKHTYGNDGSYLPWVYRIARNVAADAWHEVAVLDELDEEQEVLLPALSDHEPGNMHEQQELDQRLQRALLQLTPEHRELVLLSRVKDLSIDELAQLFGCSSGALKVRLHRSLRQLRKLFDNTDQLNQASQEASHEM